MFLCQNCLFSKGVFCIFFFELFSSRQTKISVLSILGRAFFSFRNLFTFLAFQALIFVGRFLTFLYRLSLFWKDLVELIRCFSNSFCCFANFQIKITDFWYFFVPIFFVNSHCSILLEICCRRVFLHFRPIIKCKL